MSMQATFNLMLVLGVSASLIIGYMRYKVVTSSPKTQANLIKKTGLTNQFKRGIHTELILALEDPEIRALLYDAMQEEAKLRRERKS